jgi:hypothetical protein
MTKMPSNVRGRKGAMIFLEHEGSLYRGISRAWPKEVWSRRRRKFIAYTGAVPKSVEWGTEITEAEATNMMTGAMPKRIAPTFPRRRARRRR